MDLASDCACNTSTKHTVKTDRPCCLPDQEKRRYVKREAIVSKQGTDEKIQDIRAMLLQLLSCI